MNTSTPSARDTCSFIAASPDCMPTRTAANARWSSVMSGMCVPIQSSVRATRSSNIAAAVVEPSSSARVT
ncbi:hypothetical protein [Dactylosporangium darangshiense]|uniref:hypothetical protein n=1 Tax=Dactylosporangium darangshiense TaxID=579108 RepID=UPI0036400C36